MKKRSNRQTHGLKHHPLYSRWDSMMQRCNNPKNTNYKHYGGRGIKVSEEFKNCKIYIDYIQSLPGYSLNKFNQVDRIDNDGNYERGNLKWSGTVEQIINTRIRINNKTGYKGDADSDFFTTPQEAYSAAFDYCLKELI